MGGVGRAPKEPEQRAGRHVPQRGEWQDLPPLTKPVLPLLPKRKKSEEPWSARTRQVWLAWRASWVTQLYGPDDVAAALDLAHLHDEAVRRGGVNLWTEVRHREDRLGLSQKGKRDLRLRLAESAKPEPRQSRGAKKPTLRLVNDAVVSK